jgi:hypothetical protein
VTADHVSMYFLSTFYQVIESRKHESALFAGAVSPFGTIERGKFPNSMLYFCKTSFKLK